MSTDAMPDTLDLAPTADQRPAGPPPPQAKRFERAKRPWRAIRARAHAVLGRATTVSIAPASVDLLELRPAPPPAAARAAKVKKTWREQRWERRRRRRALEEILGWILVPIILLSLYWAARSGLNALGTSPTALIQNIKAAIASKS